MTQLTPKQKARKTRNDSIVKAFQNTKGAKGERIGKIARHHKLSSGAVWNILAREGEVG